MKKQYIPVSMVFVVLFSFTLLAQTVYVTKTGSKYHKAGCSYLKRSSISISLAEAVKGYSPCSRCNPPVLNKTNSVKEEKISSAKTNDRVIGATPTGKTIYEGPRGGHYHYSKNGKKVYEKKTYSYHSSSNTTAGVTATGKTIYVGPRGGHYHYSKSGKKVYERRRR